MFKKRPEFVTEAYTSAKLSQLAQAKNLSLDIAYWDSDWSDTLYVVVQRVDSEGNYTSRPVHGCIDHHCSTEQDVLQKLQVLVNRISFMP